jgi:hypothetical protein
VNRETCRALFVISILIGLSIIGWSVTFDFTTHATNCFLHPSRYPSTDCMPPPEGKP